MKVSLKALRVNAKLSQEDVAKKLEVNKKTISSWESYNTFPSASQLMSLSKVYGCSLNDIFLPDKLAKS